MAANELTQRLRDRFQSSDTLSGTRREDLLRKFRNDPVHASMIEELASAFDSQPDGPLLGTTARRAVGLAAGMVGSLGDIFNMAGESKLPGYATKFAFPGVGGLITGVGEFLGGSSPLNSVAKGAVAFGAGVVAGTACSIYTAGVGLATGFCIVGGVAAGFVVGEWVAGPLIDEVIE